MIHSQQLKEIRIKLADRRTLSLNAKAARSLLEDYDAQLRRLDEYYDLTDRMIDFIREQGLLEKWKESHSDQIRALYAAMARARKAAQQKPSDAEESIAASHRAARSA
jgi:flagellar biosynthesis chaperone FliJ